jgi:hypothetical protein
VSNSQLSKIRYHSLARDNKLKKHFPQRQHPGSGAALFIITR